MRMGAHRFRQAEELGSIGEQERAKRTTSYDGLAQTQGNAVSGDTADFAWCSEKGPGV